MRRVKAAAAAFVVLPQLRRRSGDYDVQRRLANTFVTLNGVINVTT